MTALKELGPSVIRTVVPWLVGLLVAFLIDRGISIDEGTATAIVTTVVSTLYYAIVRVLETRLSPLWGWAIGSPKQPTYQAPAAPSKESPTGFEATPDAPAAIPEGAPVDVEPARYDGFGAPISDRLDDVVAEALAQDYKPKH